MTEDFEAKRREVAEDWHEEPSRSTGTLAWFLLMAVVAMVTSGTLVWALVALSLGGF